MQISEEVSEWMMAHAPDVEGTLGRVFNGTGLLRGGASDYVTALAVACAFPVMRFIMDRCVYGPLARHALGIPQGDPKKTDEPVSQQQLDTYDKFKESAYKCGVQVCFTIVLLLVGLNKPWFYNTKLYWADCRWPCEAPISYGERFVYCLVLGFYVQAVPMLFLWETKRKDRLEVFAHHVATIVLISYSYYLNLTRVGFMVLVCHESNDIFLEAAKMARYVKHESLTTAIFVVFMLSWFTTRVYMFPVFVIRSTLFESRARAAELGVQIQPHHAILNGFLIFLYCLHVYWSYLILRIAVKQLTTGGAAYSTLENMLPDGALPIESHAHHLAIKTHYSGRCRVAANALRTAIRHSSDNRAYHHMPECTPGQTPGVGCDAVPCPVPWAYTDDRQTANVVLFNTLDGMAGYGDASSRPPGQWSVLYAMESGKYYPQIYEISSGINISADYRLDSDVPVTYWTPSEYPDLKAMPVPFAQKRTDGLIAVFISNCGPKNNRNEVLTQLIELLPGLVHSYGGCQHNMDANDTKIATISRYKFAFTPENSNDVSYVTEKIYHALQAGTVPIYIGAPDVHRFVPVPDAVIRVDDFASIEALVDYLKQAANDQAVYNKHVAWKNMPESSWSEARRQHINNLVLLLRLCAATRQQSRLAGLVATLMAADRAINLSDTWMFRHPSSRVRLAEALEAGWVLLQQQPGNLVYEQTLRYLKQFASYQVTPAGREVVHLQLAQFSRDQGHGIDAWDFLSSQDFQTAAMDADRRALMGAIKLSTWQQAMQGASAPALEGHTQPSASPETLCHVEASYAAAWQHDARVWVRGGRMAKELHRDAVDSCQIVLDQRPEAGDVMQMTAQLLIAAGDMTSALSMVQLLQKRAPHNADVWALGALLLSIQQAQQSLDASPLRAAEAADSLCQLLAAEPSVHLTAAALLSLHKLRPLTAEQLVAGCCLYLDNQPPSWLPSLLELTVWQHLAATLIHVAATVLEREKQLQDCSSIWVNANLVFNGAALPAALSALAAVNAFLHPLWQQCVIQSWRTSGAGNGLPRSLRDIMTRCTAAALLKADYQQEGQALHTAIKIAVESVRQQHGRHL
ncbi:LAG1 longevity assurance 1 [Chlorella vulgaris]